MPALGHPGAGRETARAQPPGARPAGGGGGPQGAGRGAGGGPGAWGGRAAWDGPRTWGGREAGGGPDGRRALVTVFQHRFGSGAGTLRAVAASGALGRPLLAICHTTWFRDQGYFEERWRGRWASEGGGPTLGHGIHQMDLLLHVLGDWTEVSAVARRQARSIETEDLSLAHVSFASGAAASVVNSVLSPREESYLRFDFERGTVELRHLYGYADQDWRVTPRRAARRRCWAPGLGAAGGRSGHQAQFAEVLRALEQGRAAPGHAAGGPPDPGAGHGDLRGGLHRAGRCAPPTWRPRPRSTRPWKGAVPRGAAPDRRR